MGISRIQVHDFKKHFGNTRGEHNFYVAALPPIIRQNLPEVTLASLDVYNLRGEQHNFKAGRAGSRLVIYSNATAIGASETLTLEQAEPINGIENNFTIFMSPHGKGVLIASDKGIPLAEWFEDQHELNILFDLFKEWSDNAVHIFDFIMKEFYRLVWLPKTFENSWVHTQDKAKLTEKLTKQLQERQATFIANETRNIEEFERLINNYRREIKTKSDILLQRRRQVETEKQNSINASAQLINDLDLIVANEKIKDVRIKNDLFIVTTVPLYISASNGKRFYGGEYRVEINIGNSDVHFFGDNPRRGYWTPNDPHPHVNGRDGSACLGNVSSAIAELCSQFQLYALVLVLIDFLESANVSDSAGSTVGRWDEVDDKGNIIRKGEEDAEEEDERTDLCNECGDYFVEDDMRNAYLDREDAEDNENQQSVCDGCRDRHYHWDDELEEYIHD